MREVEATLKVDVRCRHGLRERTSLGLTTLSMEGLAADTSQPGVSGSGSLLAFNSVPSARPVSVGWCS